MLFLLALLLVLSLILGPQLWIRWVMRKHDSPVASMPGTGGELAQHLIDRFEIHGVTVETTPQGDHYDPANRAVRLSDEVFHGRSVTAVAVAAHEVGHAIQYHRQEAITRLRQRYLPLATTIQRLAVTLLFAIPLVVAIFRVPHAALLTAVIGVAAMLVAVLIQLVILPLEWDASFNKAMPILIKGNYLPPEQHDAARQVLKAAALTYVAAALMDMLRLGRWLAILKGSIR